MIGISVITPTVGRWTLRHTLDSIMPQLSTADEVLVVSDGPMPAVSVITRLYDDRVKHLWTESPTYQWGNAQRDLAINQAQGDVLVFCDDDDELTPNALFLARQGAEDHPGNLLIFKALMAGYQKRITRILWQDREIRLGNVGTPMLVVPRLDDMPKWVGTPAPGGYAADFWFAKQMESRCAGVVWKEEVICECRKRKD